jgi:hypothetical protein
MTLPVTLDQPSKINFLDKHLNFTVKLESKGVDTDSNKDQAKTIIK